MAEYFARKGTTALGIIGTALGGLATVGGGNILGVPSAGNNCIDRETAQLMMDNALLSAKLEAKDALYDGLSVVNDKINKVVTEQSAINASQAVTNCGFTSAIAVAQNNISQLLGLGGFKISESSICVSPTTSTTA